LVVEVSNHGSNHGSSASNAGAAGSAAGNVRFFCPVLEVYVGRQVALGALAQLSVDTQWCRLRILLLAEREGHAVLGGVIRRSIVSYLVISPKHLHRCSLSVDHTDASTWVHQNPAFWTGKGGESGSAAEHNPNAHSFLQRAGSGAGGGKRGRGRGGGGGF
jgi:hypothetical protein